MAFETKTLEELVELEKDEYRSRIPEGDLTEGSDYDIEARVHAVPVFGNHAHAHYLAKQILPDTAEAAFLERHGNIRGQVKQRAAPAKGRVAIMLDGGSPPITQLAGSEITTTTGLTFTLDEDAVVTLPGWSGKTARAGATLTRVQIAPDVSGMARGHRVSISGVERTIIRVLTSIQAIEFEEALAAAPAQGTAVTAVASAFAKATASSSGTDTNQESGNDGTLSAPESGLSATCEFVEMTGGKNDETNDELRVDVLSVMAVRPASGNLEHWRRWTKETPGVGIAEAFAYPNLRGLGTMTILPFGPSSVRQLGEERNAEILAYLKTQHGHDDDVEVLQFSYLGTPQTFRFVVRPGRGYEPDVDTGGATIPLHGSTGSTTTKLQLLNVADLDRFQVGDRVVVPITVSGLPTTEQVKIASIQNAGAGDYRLNLETALSAAPVVSEDLYSGGPLWSPINAALVAYFDTLGPGDTTPASRWPASIDSFQGDIILAEIVRILKSITGVRDVTISSPSFNVATAPLFVQRLGQVRVLWSA